MKGFKSIFLLATFLIAQNAFAQTWARFNCTKDSDEGPNASMAEELILEIGSPQDGLPMEAFSINGENLKPSVKQFQFVLNPSDYKINSHIVWVEKIEPQPNSNNPEFNRMLSVAQIETKTSVSSGIESRTYTVNRLTTNVDTDNPELESFRSTFKCLEPEIL